MQEHPTDDGVLADLWVAELTAVPARSTGEIGEEERNALVQRADRLFQRLARGDLALEELSRRYSDVVWGKDGHVQGVISMKLPAPVSDWCRDSARSVGDREVLVDRESGTAWVVVVEGLYGSSAREQARAEYVAHIMAEQEVLAREARPIEYHKLGMQLTTN